MGDIPMSLINRMLQDLDARSGNAAVIVPQPAVRPVASAEKGKSWTVGAAVLCLVAVGAGAWYWFISSKSPQPVAPAVIKPTPALRAAQDKGAGAPPVVLPSAQLSAPRQAAIAAPSETPSIEKPVKDAVPAKQIHAETGSQQTAAIAASAPTKRHTESASAEPEAALALALELKTATAALREPIQAPMPAKQVRELTPYQRAENEYRRASGLAVQGKTTEAMTALEQALQLDARHAAARQMLAGMMVEAGRADDAAVLLKAGLAQDQTQPALAMSLARLQVEKGDTKEALNTLHGSLPYAADFADYHAFLAALLQRQERHKEAIDEYSAALRLAPQNGLWWMGVGISLQADNRAREAREAYSRAKAANTLSPELTSFVDQKLAQLSN